MSFADRLGQAVLDKVYNLFGYRLWFFLLDEKEISLLAVAGIGELPLVDGMGTHHNTAGLRLPEDACQANDRNFLAFDDVTKHIPCTYTGQLVDVALP